MHRHAVDVIALVCGAAFAATAVLWLLVLTEVLQPEQLRVAGPAGLILAGLVGLVAAVTRRRRPGPPPDRG